MERILSLFFDSVICLLKGFELIIKDNSLVQTLRNTIAKEKSEKEAALSELDEANYTLRNMRESNKNLSLKSMVSQFH